jgi:hypothetical protein
MIPATHHDNRAITYDNYGRVIEVRHSYSILSNYLITNNSIIGDIVFTP